MFPHSSIAVFTSLPLRSFHEWRRSSILDNRISISKIRDDSEIGFRSTNCLLFSGSRDQGHIQWEREIITPMAGTGKLFALPVMFCELLTVLRKEKRKSVVSLGDKLVVAN